MSGRQNIIRIEAKKPCYPLYYVPSRLLWRVDLLMGFGRALLPMVPIRALRLFLVFSSISAKFDTCVVKAFRS